jgi:hypothetical protein
MNDQQDDYANDKYTSEAGPLGPAKTRRYLAGECYRLAMSVADLTGWEIVEVRRPELERFAHVMVRMPNGMLLDAAGVHAPRGVRTLGDYGKPEPFHIDLWFPLDWPDEEQRWPDEETAADAAELLRAVGASEYIVKSGA